MGEDSVPGNLLDVCIELLDKVNEAFEAFKSDVVANLGCTIALCSRNTTYHVP